MLKLAFGFLQRCVMRMPMNNGIHLEPLARLPQNKKVAMEFFIIHTIIKSTKNRITLETFPLGKFNIEIGTEHREGYAEYYLLVHYLIRSKRLNGAERNSATPRFKVRSKTPPGTRGRC